MNKEKLHIPLPDEHLIKQQINQIVASGIETKPSFYTYSKTMVQQVGLRHLLSGHSMLVLIIMIVIAFWFPYIAATDSSVINVDELYAQLFLLSPILFLSFSVYTYATRLRNETYEVEMACKYNVYQLIAFRMLIFSVVTILVNTLIIVFLVMMYENVDFMRAFMISTTSLFLYSVFFLYALMKRRSFYVVSATVVFWVFANLFLRYMSDSFYKELLVGMPLFVYGFVLLAGIYFYIRALKRVICITQMKGAY